MTTKRSKVCKSVKESAVVYDPEPSGYYSHDFVVNGIRGSSRIVRIWCLRNTRITEPDIRDAFEKFIKNRQGRVEILALHPDNEDVILDGARVLLANPVDNVEEFRDDIEKNCRHVRRLWKDLGPLAERYSYLEYKCMPLIHMCQFDDCVYLGLQYVCRRNEPGCLDRLCIKVKATSALGQCLLAEFEHVRSISADYKSDPRCSPSHDELERPVAPESTRPKRSTALDGKIRAAIKRAAAGEPSFSSQTYIQAFVASGNRKAEEYVRTTAKLKLESERMAFLSIGGADGSELFSILDATRVRYGALLEWKNSAADLARKRAAEVAKKRKTVKVFEGDAIQKIAEAQAWLKDLRKQGTIDTLCCSVNSLLHELPDRGSNFHLSGFIHSIVDDWKRMLITIREPVRPKEWPSQVELKIRGVRQSTLEALAKYISQRRRIRGKITRQADDRVLMPSRLAGELLFKTFYLEEFDYEIQESVTSFSSAELERALRSEFGTHNVDVIYLNSDSFNRLYQRFGIEAHDPRAGKELSKPVMFSGLLGFKGIERL